MKQLSDLLQRDMIATDTGWIATSNPVKYIRVTRKDLENNYYDVDNCPINKACERFFQTSCFTTNSTVSLSRGGKRYKLRPKDNRKAKNRAQSITGEILGGFIIRLTPIN